MKLLKSLIRFKMLIVLLYMISILKIAAQDYSIYNPSFLQKENRKNWQEFNATYDNRWYIEWNSNTGTPHRISGYHITIPDSLTKENISEISMKILITHQKLLQIVPDNLNLISAKFDAPKTKKSGYGTWYISYEQIYRGLSVYGGLVYLIIQNQKLTVMCSDFYPGIKVSPEPVISKERAAEIACREIGLNSIIPLSSQLIIYPKIISRNVIHYFTAWQIEMPLVKISKQKSDQHPNDSVQGEIELAQWCYFIDAHSGEVLDRYNMIVGADLSGNVKGMIRQQKPSDPEQEVNIRNMNLIVTQGGNTYTGTTDINGDYTISGLEEGTAELTAQLRSDHFTITNVEASTNANHTVTVTIPGDHSWNWTTDDTSPFDVETNTFYHLNYIRDWFLRGDPFNVSPAVYSIPVYVRESSYGSYWRRFLGSEEIHFGTTSTRDFAMYSDIIYHEFTHSIVNNAGGRVYYEGPEEALAMCEGWCDYFACSINDDPLHGEDLVNRNIDTYDHHCPEHCDVDNHRTGMIFSGAIWDTRTFLGSEYTDNLAFRTLKSHCTSFSSYLGAFLEADDNPAYNPSGNEDMTDGTPNIDIISHCFYDLHGIYNRYIVGHTDKPIAVILTPDPCLSNIYSSELRESHIYYSNINIIGCAYGSETSPLDNFIVEYANAETSGTWLTDGISLTGDGTSPIIEANLATLDISNLSTGNYLIRLTVTDTEGHTNSITTKVFIDKLGEIFFPPKYSLPFESGPFIDGIVDKNPDPDGDPELGWNNAYRLTFGNGTDPQVAFQCLRSNDVSASNLYMSFEVKNDPAFNDEDLIILNFRPDKNSDEPQNDFRIFIYPVYTGAGAKDPASADMSIEDNPDEAKANRPCRDIRFYQRQLEPDGITWNWVQITDILKDDFEFKVYSYNEGDDIGASYSWNVEMKMPRSIKRAGDIEWIRLQDEFLFFFDVFRANEDPTNGVQYIWPKNLLEEPTGDLESEYTFPAYFWGDASLSSDGNCKGVWIEASEVGVLNDPCQRTGFTSGDLSTNIKTGQFNASGELTSRAINRFMVTLRNNSEEVKTAGSRVTLEPVSADDIKVRLRIAHWGASLGSGDDWRVISGLQPTDIVDPPFPEKPAGCTSSFTFHTTTDEQGCLPAQDIPEATGTAVPTPGTGRFYYDWILLGDENDGEIKYYKDIQRHQCVYVEVSSNSNANILTRSLYRNMNFVEASSYSDTARISTKGCGIPPNGWSNHDIFLQTRLKTWIVPRDSTKTKARWMQGYLYPTEKQSYYRAPVSMPNPNVFITKNIASDSYAEYIVDGYYYTGKFVIINNKRFDLLSPLGSFGYIAHHGEAVEEWQTNLQGLDNGNNGLYNIEISPNNHLDIYPSIESREPYRYILSIHGGVSLPVRTITNTHSTGINGAVDFEYRKSSCIFFSSLIGYNQFPALNSSTADLRITTLSAIIKYRRPFSVLFYGYAGLGPEMLIVLDEGTRFALMGDAGFDLRLNYRFSIELGARYNMEINRNYEFFNVTLGLLVKL
jgi:Zn-dependent metalloprotease